MTNLVLKYKKLIYLLNMPYKIQIPNFRDPYENITWSAR